MHRLIAKLALIITLVPVFSYGQTNYPVRHTLPGSVEVYAGSDFTLTTTFEVEDSWYVYAPTGNNTAQGMIETTVYYELPKGISRKGKMIIPEPALKNGFEVYTGKDIRITQNFGTNMDLSPGDYVVKARVSYQSCKNETCLPPMSDEVEVRLVVKAPGASTVANNESLQLQFTALDGSKVSAEKLKGKVVLIDCWASWCRPCIAEFEKLKKLYATYHNIGFEIIGLNVDELDARQRVLNLIAGHKLPWPQGFEGKGFKENSFVKQYGISALPAVFLINKEGNIVDKDARGEKLEGLIQRYLK